MQKLMQEPIARLVATNSSPAVTMYIPMETSAAPPHITENQIRLKNMFTAAIEQIPERGEESVTLKSELHSFLDDHMDDIDFWKSQSKGLLVCAAPGMLETYALPIDTEEYVSVDDTFHLAPVLALLGDAREFYVLALAQHQPKLYRGDMYGLELQDISLPASLRESLGIDETNLRNENQGSAVGSSLRTGGYNGRGGGRDPQDADRMRFLHMIDKQLWDKTDRSLPLILAGTDAEAAEFRSLSKYPHMLHGMIHGNHTETRPDELHKKAWAIVSDELIRPDHAAAREEYERLSGANPERVAHGTEAISAAAEQGRIEKLLTQMSQHTPDTVRDSSESVLRISFPEPHHSTAINKLAAKVWQMSGKVISLLPGEMPHGAPMLARLRY